MNEEEVTQEEAEVETDDTAADEEEVEQVDEYMSIDDLLGLTEEDYPELSEDANHTGMKPLHEWMQHLPEEARMHVGNIRASYTRKTQEIAALRKELEAEREALRQQQELAMNNPILSEAEKHITEDEHDVYTEEGMQAEIKKQAALMLQQMMKPAQEKIQLEQRQVELQRFKSNNPELTQDEYRLPIAEMLKARPELKLEDAFYIVKAKIDSSKAAEERAAMQQQKKTRRSTLTKTSTGASSKPSGTPRFRNAIEAYEWHKNNPGKK